MWIVVRRALFARVSVKPSPRLVPVVPRQPQPVNAPPRSAAPVAAPPPDETLAEGARRRFAALVADLRVPADRWAWMLIVGLTGLLLYSYWPGLMNARSSWSNPQYSHGWIVPLCALMLLFWWRQPIREITTTARLAGLALLLGSFLLRLFCARYRIITLDMYTFVPALTGVFLLAGGWGTLRWAWAPILTLIFMYPLPDEATRYLLGPLQTLATAVSTYALQTFGYDAYREGNRIVLGEDHVLGVVDACSGLRMLTIFVWLCVMLALVGEGEWWEKLVIVASSVPIALIVNATRITLTGVMYTINPEIAEKIFHDWAGYFMMPLALGLLFGLQSLLRQLVITEELAPTRLGGGVAGPGRVAASPGRSFPALAPNSPGPGRGRPDGS